MEIKYKIYTAVGFIIMLNVGYYGASIYEGVR